MAKIRSVDLNEPNVIVDFDEIVITNSVDITEPDVLVDFICMS